MILKKSLLLFIRLSVVNAAFYSAISNHGKLNDKDVIYKTTAPSSISCLLQCRVIDAEADAIFDQNVCSCIKGRTQKDDTKEVSLTGICLKGNSRRWKRIMIAGKELEIVKNQLQTTIPKLTIEYVLSMDVKATKWPKTKKNVFLMTTGQDSGIPGIWFKKGKVQISARVNSGDVLFVKDNVSLKKWVNIKVSQIENTSGEIRYSIEVDGKVLHTVINKVPIEFSQVECYISSKESHQPGIVKNVWLDVRTE